MDQHSQFHIAYHITNHEHRITSLERGRTQAKRNALRLGLFLVLWLVAILSNLTSGQISSLLSIAVKSGSQML